MQPLYVYRHETDPMCLHAAGLMTRRLMWPSCRFKQTGAAAEAAAAEAAAQEVVHEENSWGIAVMPQEATGSTEEPVHRASANGSLVEGIEYSMPVREPITCCSCCW